MNDDLVAFVMVSVTLAMLLLRPLLVIVQTPLVFVVQVAVPVVPFVHFMLTVTPETGCSFTLCTIMVTVAFQEVELAFAELRSRSPMWSAGADVFVGEAVGADVAVNVGRRVDVAGTGVKVGRVVGEAGTDVKVGKGVAEAGMDVLVGRAVGEAGIVVSVGGAMDVGVELAVGNGAPASH